MGNNPSIWADCDRVPFRYAIHGFQHNERMIGRFLMKLPDSLLNRLSYYQHQRRLSAAIDPLNFESWLWAYSSDYERAGVSFIPDAWSNALIMMGLSIYQSDPDTGSLIPVAPLNLGALI